MEILGLEVDDLPEGWHPLDVAVVVKCMDTTDDSQAPMRLSFLYSGTLTSWEALGMLRAGMLDLEDVIREDTDG